MGTKDKLLSILRDQFDDLQEGLFELPESDRVTGFVATDRFAEIDHDERQALLWSIIDSKLTKDERRHIGPIVTMSLEEAALKSRDD